MNRCVECRQIIRNDSVRCLSCSNKRNCKNSPRMAGKHHKAETKAHFSRILKGDKNPFYGKKHTLETKIKILKSQSKKFWNRKNKKEEFLEQLLNELYPKEYKFVGNGKFIIESFCPDFINVNGQKKIIEFFGDYWHNLNVNKERDKLRLQAYNNYGYKTLVVWEHELTNITELKNRVIAFHQEY